MTRRGLFSSLLGTAAATGVQIEERQKFYITGGQRLDPKQNDCNVSPLVCYGRDRLDALTSSGVTVWHAEDYERGQKHFEEACKRVPDPPRKGQ